MNESFKILRPPEPGPADRIEETSSSLFECNPSPSLLFRRKDLGIVRLNAAALQFFGYTQDQVRSLTLETLLDPYQAKMFRATLLSGVPVNNLSGVWRFFTSRHETRFAELTLIRSYAEGEHPLLMLREIASQHFLENEVELVKKNYIRLFENSTEAMYRTSPGGRFLAVNQAFATILGYDHPDEVTARYNRIDEQLYVDPARRQHLRHLLDQYRAAKNLEFEAYRRDGSHVWLSVTAWVALDGAGKTLYYEGVARDVTFQKAGSGEPDSNHELLSCLANASSEAIIVVKGDAIIDGNEAFFSMTGLSRKAALRKKLYELLTREGVGITRPRTTDTTSAFLIRHDGVPVCVEARFRSICLAGQNAEVVVLRKVAKRQARKPTAAVIDINRNVSHKLSFLNNACRVLASSLDYRTTVRNAVDLLVPAMADCCIVYLVSERRTIEAAAVAHRDEVKRETIRRLGSQYMRTTVSNDIVSRVIRTGQSQLAASVPDEWFSSRAHNEDHLRQLKTLDFASSIVCPLTTRDSTIGALFLAKGKAERPFDLNDLHFAENLAGHAALAIENSNFYERTTRLADDVLLSNKEWEKSAYIVSHDLQEPLRMVTSYLGLLRRKYLNRIDDTADDFIQQASDGAARMKLLLDDLMIYSRVSTGNLSFEIVPVGNVIETTLDSLKEIIKAANATITVDSQFPYVLASPASLRQVFYNLIANSLKFRRDEPPDIHVSWTAREGECLFTVRDNGIGFDSEHAIRIFDIFRRLHGRDDYPGTGIGLALCKRIIEGHRGRIWAESEAGLGSAFHFTLPDARTTNAAPRSSG